LLSVRNQTVGHETEYDWTGDLVVSIYSLQTNIENYNSLFTRNILHLQHSKMKIDDERKEEQLLA
jgi:hypothetical protein